MKKLTYSLLALLFCLPGNVHAQSIWDADHLADVKQSLDRPYYTVAYQQLKAEADRLLPVEPLSVMMKDKLPASGDKHDYMSQARYFWLTLTVTECRIRNWKDWTVTGWEKRLTG